MERMKGTCCILASLIVAAAFMACAPPGESEESDTGMSSVPVIEGVVEYEEGAVDAAGMNTAAASNRPVKGAKVKVKGSPFSDVTDENGEFRIVGTPPGKLNVVIEKDADGNGMPDYISHGTFESVYWGVKKRVMAPEAGRVIGRVTLDGGEAGNDLIKVCLADSEYCAYTDERGFYDIGHIACKREWTVVAEAECYDSASMKEVYVNCGMGRPVYVDDMDLIWNNCGQPETGALTGKAKLTDSYYSENVLVTLSDGKTARTDRMGNYTFPALNTGTYDVSASMEGYLSVSAENVAVTADETVVAPDLYLAPKALPDCDGDGTPNVEDLDDDNDGFPDLDEELYGTDPCDPASMPVGTIEGTVSGSGSGAPLSGALVLVQGTDMVAVTDDFGAFVFGELHAGTVSLAASMTGYEDGTASLRVEPGAVAYADMFLDPSPVNTAPVATILTPEDGSSSMAGEWVTLSGVVSDAEDPAGALAVRWTSSIDGYLGSVTPTDAGELSLDVTLSAGSHVLTLEALDSGMLEGKDSVTVPVLSPVTVQPKLCADQTNLDFGDYESSLYVHLWNCGDGGELTWTASADQRWTTVFPPSGSLYIGSYQSLYITVDRTELRSGDYYGNILIDSNGGKLNINVHVTVP